MIGYECLQGLEVVADPIVRAATLGAAAHVSVWRACSEGPAYLAGLTTWQVHQLRRIARITARMPWRDNQLAGEAVRASTRIELRTRGAAV